MNINESGKVILLYLLIYVESIQISVPITNLHDSTKYPALFDWLTKSQKGESSWTSNDLKKLAGLNFIRVWKRVEKVTGEC